MRCPSPATSEGGQSLKCKGCTNIPVSLPAGASHQYGCTVICTGHFVYHSSSNTCVGVPTRGNGLGQQSTWDHTFTIVAAAVVGVCVLACCYYAFKGRWHNNPPNNQLNVNRPPGVAPIRVPTRIRVQLSQYPVTQMQADTQLANDADACVICLNEFKVGDRLRTLSCKHAFHMVCLDSWLEAHTTCPLCNVQLETQVCPVTPGDAERARWRTLRPPRQSAPAAVETEMNAIGAAPARRPPNQIEPGVNPVIHVPSPQTSPRGPGVNPG